jgi:hypothetical protein
MFNLFTDFLGCKQNVSSLLAKLTNYHVHCQQIVIPMLSVCLFYVLPIWLFWSYIGNTNCGMENNLYCLKSTDHSDSAVKKGLCQILMKIYQSRIDW